MSIEHHPAEELLAAYAAGTLDHGQHVAIATHLVACRQCRDFSRSIEDVGGVLVTETAPAAMSDRAFADVEARLSEPAAAVAPKPSKARSMGPPEVPGLPAFVRGYRFGQWTWIAPSVHVRRIELPFASATRVFLLKSGPGTTLLQHTHTGVEMTCVLSGAFRQGDAHYRRGDFDSGDDTVEHQPMVEPEGECVCLVAMQGELKLKGLFGRVLQPFIRL
jgi:putative transcriptional regulator